MKRIAVLTSGGDSPGMNAAVRAVVRKAIFAGLEVYGIERGYEGLLDAEFVPMHLHSVAGIIHRGGTILKTSRSERFLTQEGQSLAIANLKKAGIDGLIVIGGDGSLRGGLALSTCGVMVAGVPATIDNDLNGTDYTIGFDTALNTVLEATDRIRDTAISHERIAIIEVMGRNCGFLALYAGVAGGAEEIIVPEKKWDIAEICAKVLEKKRRKKLYSIIIVAEGAAGGGEIARLIQERTGVQASVTVLGYTQRGGSPSAQDALLASQLGAKAVELLLQGENARLAGIHHGQIVTPLFADILKESKELNWELYELATVLAT